jgi:hypothetical protein
MFDDEFDNVGWEKAEGRDLWIFRAITWSILAAIVFATAFTVFALWKDFI